MDVVFSGVQPTGNLHIGNYVGAISLWVKNQHRHRNFFCIVDLHALTNPENVDRKKLRQSSFDVPEAAEETADTGLHAILSRRPRERPRD